MSDYEYRAVPAPKTIAGDAPEPPKSLKDGWEFLGFVKVPMNHRPPHELIDPNHRLWILGRPKQALRMERV